MKILNSKILKEIDEATCKAQEIDSLELMERAASAVTCEIISRFLPSRRIVVMAGPGNNGGDALAVARLLIEQGYRRVEIYLFNIKGKLSHDCNEERKRLISIEGVNFTEVNHDFHPPRLDEDDLVVDGLFGSGLRDTLQGGFVALANLINDSGAYVVSIDVPSGLSCEWNSHAKRSNMVHADLTLSIQLPRLAFFFSENEPVIGEWKLLDIELDKDSIRSAQTDFMMVDVRSVRPLLKKRDKFTGKRDYGSALMFTGSAGMMGAAVLSAQAALRSGAGLVTVHSASCGMPILQTAVPEAMFEPDRNKWLISEMKMHHSHQAIGVGCGIGTNEETINALEHLLKNASAPLVLDADALNCIAKRPSLLSVIPANTIITPHAGEFDRLFGEHVSDEERLLKAIEMARYYSIFIVLKGHYTATVRPTGRVYFNSTGNPGMATAGSGDVLTGIITALLAQGYRPELAATIGVYLHGLAGDIACSEMGEAGMTAGDIAARAGLAMRSVIESKKQQPQ